MTLSPSTLRSPSGAKRGKKRLGRGNASGHGTYSTRGLKGQRARQGGRKGLTQFGVKHFIVHLPKVRGFQSLRPGVQAVSLSAMSAFASGTEVTPEMLAAKGLVVRADMPVKVIGNGPVKASLVIKVHGISQGAKAAVEKAGGSVELVETLKRPVPSKPAKR